MITPTQITDIQSQANQSKHTQPPKQAQSELRSNALQLISELLPNLYQINVPSYLQTQKLIKLSNYIKYSIPADYIPFEYQEILLALTQYYYSWFCKEIRHQNQNDKCLNDVKLETIISEKEKDSIQDILEIVKQEQKSISTEIQIKITENIQYQQQKTFNITNKYLSITQYLDYFKNLPVSVQIAKASPQTVKSVNLVNSWTKTTQIIQLTSPMNRNKKNFSRKLSEKKESFREGQSDRQTSSSLIIGRNEDKETKQLRQELKKRAENNFKKVSQDKESEMSEKQKTQTNMHFQLNKVSLQNIDEIFQQLKPYVAQQIKSEETSLVLIQKIIDKCQNEHYRYIATYAKLCQKLSTISKSNFISGSQRMKGKGNLFKKLLVESLQREFDSKVLNKNVTDSKETLKFFKYQFVGCVIFIAQLIKLKVLSEKIINICLTTMMVAAIQCIKNQKYSVSSSYKKMNQLYIQIYLETIIKFIETLGVNYNCIVINPQCNQKNLKLKITNILTSVHPNYDEKQLFFELCVANSEGYLSIMELINENSLKQYRDSSRIDLLILNIIQNFNYALIEEKSQEEAQDDIKSSHQKQDSSKQEQVIKITSEVKEILQFCSNSHIDDSVVAIKNTMEESSVNRDEKVKSFLRLIADAKEQQVIYRLKIFKKALESFDDPQQWLKSFKNAWFNDFKYLSTLGSDLKHLTQVLAQLLRLAIDCERVTLTEYKIDCDDEDQLQFMNQIVSKLYEFEGL